MKKILQLILLILPTIIYGQQIVKKSDNIVLLLGKKYYIHTVKDGETLYGISKTYDIPAKEIMLINQDEVVNLQADDVLKIPFEKEKELSDIKITFVMHTVQKKQSLYSIAQEYGLTQDEILYYNVFAQNGISKGDILQIPLKSTVNLLGEDAFFIYHQVKEKETLLALAKKYNISEEKIKQVNPNITAELTVGQIVNIPKKEFTNEEFLIIQGDSTSVPNLLDVDNLYFTDPSCVPCKEFVYKKDKVFKVAYLLPLFLDENYSLSIDLVSDPKTGSFYSTSERFLEFYEGSLVAINNLRELGLSVDITVYDTKKDSLTIASILAKPEIKKMDLIIGPLYSENLQQVARFAAENRINIVSPLSQKTEMLLNNPFVYQVVPSKKMLINKTAEYFSNYYDSSIVVIHNGTDAEAELISIYKQKIKNNFAIETDLKEIVFNEVNYSKEGATAVTKALKKNTNNIIIIPSEEEVFVSKILNNLMAQALEGKYNITVYGMPSWEFFNNIKIEHLQNLHLHYPATSYVDYTDWQTKKFILTYRETYFAEPSAYSFQGYDITYYFLSALKRYGKYFQFCLTQSDLEPSKRGIFLDFNFLRIDNKSGFENNGVYMLNYDADLNIKKTDIQK